MILGKIKPIRLFPKILNSWEGVSIYSPGVIKAKILEIIPRGNQEVCAITTSTGTYISNGFLSHNCDFKRFCYPDMRIFLTSKGPKYFSKIVKEPSKKLVEITNGYPVDVDLDDIEDLGIFPEGEN